MTTEQLLDLGLQHHYAGNMAQAQQLYQDVLKRDPRNADAQHLLGVIAYQTGDHDTAIKLIRKAIKISEQVPMYHNSLGLALQGKGRYHEADRVYRFALALKPNFVEAHTNLGNVLRMEKKFDDALTHYQQALSLQPDLADAYCGIGQTYYGQEKIGDALQALQRALKLNPDHAITRNALGLLHFTQNRLDEAVTHLQHAITVKPNFAEAHTNLGMALNKLGDSQGAIACYQRALALKPDLGEASLNLAETFRFRGDIDEAVKSYRHALTLHPGDPGTTVKLATVLPVVPQSDQDLTQWRTRFERGLTELENSDIVLTDPFKEIGRTNFYLSYHALNNRDLHTRMARFYEKACPSLSWVAPHCRAPKPKQGPIKIGFISKYMRNHSIGKITRGYIDKLDRERFHAVAIFVPPFADDDISHFIRANVQQSVDLPESLEAARQAIAALELDILFYQDIGMEVFTYFLAFARLAPVQCVSFGHPDTTGIPNMDYFVSNELFEPEDAADHYSEKLFLLRNLPTLAYSYRPTLPQPIKDRSAFGLASDAHIYICPQTPFKFHPQFDQLLANILRADPNGLLVLVQSNIPHWAELLKVRLRKTIPEAMDRILFLPHQNGADFVNLLAVADVVLDPPQFNGMTSSLEAFSVGTPIVTLPTAYQRGRHTSGMYRRMGLTECIARTPEHYVEIALRLGTDADYRQHIKNQILQRNDALFEDMQVIREFERFFVEAVGRTA